MTAPWHVAVAFLAVLVILVFLRVGGRRRLAQRHLVRLHAAAHHPSRRLVEVVRPLRRAKTGELLLVIDASTGQEAAVWLEMSSRWRAGDVALLVWMHGRWVPMDGVRASRSNTSAQAPAGVDELA